jgi:chromosome segregation protein
MRLKHIKLSGFKSFVDPTTISVPADLVGVIGPNGCGKSNVIDAVRWVMGESSAKTLRGDSMADVIFNGSSARKPVGKAAVELVFDNNQGKAPGAYASYSEIAIRRELSRDGQSNYYINKDRCRRRDITDIFLGTGLGPRSYSIIEQGMVSRIIEAKPEDLRVLIEEAAGISKYKDRRRETETRIRHTRENLARVQDIRSELETQLRRLKRQSSAAARYKELKQEERLLKAQLLSLRWRELDRQVGERDRVLATRQQQVDARLADQRGVERRIEELRQRQTEANEVLNKVQGSYYRAGAEIASVEQEIAHLRETRQQQQQELERLFEARGEADTHLSSDIERIGELERQLGDLSPRLEQADRQFNIVQAEQEQAEREFHAWQMEWEQFGRVASQPDQDREVQKTRLSEHEQQIRRLIDRENRLDADLQHIEDELSSAENEELADRITEMGERCLSLERDMDGIEAAIQAAREQLALDTRDIDELRNRRHSLEARLESLQEMQAAALGENDPDLAQWLASTDLNEAPRLAAELRVADGWERAADRVLGARVGAVRVESLDRLGAAAAGFSGSELYLVERSVGHSAAPGRWQRLSDVISCDQFDLTPWLRDIFTAEDIVEALARRPQLGPRESVVTRDGAWVGPHWLALVNDKVSRAGLMARENEIEKLAGEVTALQAAERNSAAGLDAARMSLAELEEALVQKRKNLAAENHQLSEARSRYARLEAHRSELQSRRERLLHDLGDVHQHLQQLRGAVDQANTLLGKAKRAALQLAEQRDALLARRDQLRDALNQVNERANTDRESRHALAMDHQRWNTELEAVRERAKRLQAQETVMQRRQRELDGMLSDGGQPRLDLEQKLAALLAKRIEVEKELGQARDTVSEIDESLRAQAQGRAGLEQGVQSAREELEQASMERQEIKVRRDTVFEQIREADFDASALLEQLPEEASVEAWQEDLDRVCKRIDRIGPVNLVAIEEYEEQSQRKAYLDKQHQDLVEALATLESVIQKIDRETRMLFKETFESLNQRFQGFFPRLFGGGSAYLELTGNDLLETGVGVMARPPGKRNSTIHLLSGGEKALTAVSLLFSFFDLNPAPFCMLDEVDAPLDDANVERYSEVLKTLADRTQLIFITHNKITMERADILIGVTMGEPGVSRLVAVDVEEAMQIAAQ